MARVDRHSPGVFEVVLSRRNLLALLTKLEIPESERTLAVGSHFKPDGVLAVTIRAEDDEAHYSSPLRKGVPAGPLHPATEVLMPDVEERLCG